ncbi:1078_t:CDS:2 [Acaulospora morrowiae]|uniref:1078_t:CDS:1 n=1 Tax=Acaulospora morrowiae TaxID=94023 RepID=A0A9N9G551_9GLOM|nr:1078_t:CDS:2 [Acaulospora morrowiae]
MINDVYSGPTKAIRRRECNANIIVAFTMDGLTSASGWRPSHTCKFLLAGENRYYLEIILRRHIVKVPVSEVDQRHNICDNFVTL